MGTSFRLIIVLILILLSSSPKVILAKEIKYNHNSITVPEIKKKVDFTVFTPKKIPSDWTLDTKTYPWGVKENFTHISLHYMDSKDTKLMVAIHQEKGFPLTNEKSPYSQPVDINGIKGYFQEWDDNGEVNKNGDTITGGLLKWVQDGTYVEMMSSRIQMEKMLKIARSLN